MLPRGWNQAELFMNHGTFIMEVLQASKILKWIFKVNLIVAYSLFIQIIHVSIQKLFFEAWFHSVYMVR